MADDSYFSQIINALTGSKAAAPPAFNETVNLAPPPASYPSDYDARMARENGFSQGNVNQSFLDNDKAKVLGHNLDLSQFPTQKKQELFIPESGAGRTLTDVSSAADDPTKSATVDMTSKVNQPMRGRLENLMMRGALAANRIPIAAVGFDPNRTVIDPLLTNGTVSGVYNPKADSIYSNADPVDPSTLVHESIHRGLAKLRQENPDQVGSLMNKIGAPEETVVRWLMQSGAGDPEGATPGAVNQKQRADAAKYFNDPVMGPDAKAALDQLQEMAIQNVKNRGKRFGPQ